ncbi:MmcQ/YjbR family DNA-binding protein [Microbacterium fluvii]|uniref:MmcQ/YjbR family DNA-binding protein n=1 Tax=Microbacterium fluvii TaxID=415215 RepID=A0ABW2HHK0_9MICO|nr:MmcQ/YjbR family DNA-binding protein [Microbacterium fluvii]MCU4672931.1 MmcQ/YjbR family DNA-binding protein [Microbacterium fluvii]
MSHPIMFDDDDPVLGRVRRVALALPEADEKVSHGRPTFFTTKVFCYYGGSQRIDDEWVRHDRAVLVVPDPGDAPALRQDPRFWVPAYLGPRGWLGLDLDERADWGEIAELIDASYRATAARRLVRRLDDEGLSPGRG